MIIPGFKNSFKYLLYISWRKLFLPNFNFSNLDAIEVNGLKEPDISMITGRLRTNGCDEVDESSNYCRDICSYVAGYFPIFFNTLYIIS